jgi:mannose-6-phosphate isomerase-like protein (cupin superfamily)
MATRTSRRNFLRSAPLAAAAASLSLPEVLQAQSTPAGTATPLPIKVVTAAELAQREGELKAKPGNFDFSPNPALPFTCVMTVETDKAGKEFEWHEGRDHIFQIVEGETTYELGGTPEGAHMTKPGEWLAPKMNGATTVTLKKGDVLMVPRNTAHKRTTKGSVTFYLFSVEGPLKKTT